MRKSTAAHECVSDEALAHLKTYRYSSVDKSLISRYILKHYWNGFVELLPLWLAPNMVTLLGFFFILGNVVLLEIYQPDLVTPGPSWLYCSFALGLWMYSTMDNVDGKQARRTGTSSGLGELFDHGIDSLNCTLASLLEVAAICYGPTKTGAFTALIPCLPMFFSTWETYHTHTLYLGYFNGPTEGLIIACTVMLLSAMYGPNIWTMPIVYHFPSLVTYLPPTITPRDLWVPTLLLTFLIAHLPACVLNVARARRARNLPLAPIFWEWTPMVVFTGGCMAWLGSPWSSILTPSSAFHSLWGAGVEPLGSVTGKRGGNHLVLFCATMSLVFGRMTTKIILAHLTRQPFPYWTTMLVPLVGGAALVNLSPLLAFGPVNEATELWYLRAYFVFALVVYTRWAVLVINSICNFLGISCLTIPVKEKEGEKVGLGKLRVEKKSECTNGSAAAKRD